METHRTFDKTKDPSKSRQKESKEYLDRVTNHDLKHHKFKRDEHR